MRMRKEEFKRSRKSKLCKKQRDMHIKMVSSKDLLNNMVQDEFKRMVVVGSDVVSLYPNLRLEVVGEETNQTVLDS